MKINLDLLKEFENSIDTVHPDKGKIPINILGYGEISLVFEIINDSEHLAYKRLPIFKDEEIARDHEYVFKEYNRILKEELNINTPPFDVVWFEDEKGKIAFYSIQEKIIPESVGNKVIHQVSDKEVEMLVLLAMREMKKVWSFNKKNKSLDVGLDGQISNFAIANYDPLKPKVDENSKLIYIDTVPPFYRVHGDEAMEIALLARSMPWFVRGLLKAIFLQDIVDGYYDWRTTTIDLIANFYKEQRPELVPGLVEVINKFFIEEAKEFEIEPITLKEVEKYYKTDKLIWKLYLGMRKFDRFIKTKIFRRKYPFYLPGKIKR
jgi:hypothetical protein